MPINFDRLLEELADMHVFLDVDLTDFPILAQYSSLPSARNLVFEAADAVARARAKEGDQRLERRALQAIGIARQAVKKASGVVTLVRIHDTLRDRPR
jgi:hypothetical protein